MASFSVTAIHWATIILLIHCIRPCSPPPSQRFLHGPPRGLPVEILLRGLLAARRSLRVEYLEIIVSSIISEAKNWKKQNVSSPCEMPGPIYRQGPACHGHRQLRPPPLCSLPSRLPHAICLTSPLFFMVLFCFFFIDAGHALAELFSKFDDAAMAGNAAVIAILLCGSKHAFV